MTWYWINYCEPNRLLGIIVTKAESPWIALRNLRDIDPGGFIAYMEMDARFGDPPDEYVDRLLTFEDAGKLSLAWTKTEIVNGRGEMMN